MHATGLQDVTMCRLLFRYPVILIVWRVLDFPSSSWLSRAAQFLFISYRLVQANYGVAELMLNRGIPDPKQNLLPNLAS